MALVNSSCRLGDNEVKGTLGGNSSIAQAKFPVNFSATAVSDSSIELSWQGSEGRLGAYQVAYVVGLTPPSDCALGATVSGFTGTAITISNLQDGTDYSFRVCRIDSASGELSTGVTGVTRSMEYCDYRKYRSPYANSGDSEIDGTTKEKAFTICTPVQMDAIGSVGADLDKNFLLKKDLDMSELTIAYTAPSISGTFHGEGKIIKNLSTGKGVFNQVNGLVEKLGVENVSLRGVSNSGAIAGFLSSMGTVRECFATGANQESASFSNIMGGLIGQSYGVIENSYAHVDINAPSINFLAGGAIGSNVGTVNNAYASGDVIADTAWSVGGFTGENNGIPGPGATNNVFALGRVEGDSSSFGVGPITGSFNNGGAVPTNSFYLSFADCTNNGSTACNANGTQIGAASDFYNSSNAPLSSWNFSNVWQMPTTGGLPILKWQTDAPIESYCWQDMRMRNAPYANSGEVGMDGSSEAKALTICTAKQLNNIGANIGDFGKYFKLAANINMGHLAGTEYNIIGSNINNFTGQFDGQYHRVYNLTINTTASFVGMFGQIGASGVVKNLALINIDITAHQRVGGIAGVVEGIVEQVFVTGKVTGDGVASEGLSGGIVGTTWLTGIVQDCFANVTINFPTSGFVIGGIFGEIDGGRVSRCYSRGTVLGGAQEIGGLGGEIDGGSASATAEDSFSVMTSVQGDGFGPAVGFTFGDVRMFGTYSGMYFDSSATCTNIHASGTCGPFDSAPGVTGIDLGQNPNYFFDKNNPPLDVWDFTNVWQEVPGSFPVLKGFQN